MAFAPRCFLILALLTVRPGFAGPARVFRQWIAGQEAGGSSEQESGDGRGQLMESHEWNHLERMGTVIQQDLKQQARKLPDGSMSFSWTLTMSQEPMTGEGSWSPREPGKLKLTFGGGSPRTLDVPPGAVLWPGDQDDALKAAARAVKAVSVQGFSFPTQQWTSTTLKPVGPEPLPGFPDTVHFRGRSAEGSLVEEVDLWISPVQGEVKHLGTIAGIPFLSQRSELPPPAVQDGGSSLFQRTIKALPPHPFLLWLPQVRVRWSGTQPQELREDAQQRRLGPGSFRLVRAQPPSAREALDPPVTGRPSPEDAPFLAATPLVQFRDPVFDGLERRLNPPRNATRWELAQRVTSFVYDWIREKNYTVGFATAQEVARNPQGACAQHGVLAVALLRRLGVPARGVTGWMAFGETLGLHFWVEARIAGRWIPLDPTFDEAPASAYRLKLGTTDLADLGGVGPGSPDANFLDGVWVPAGPWTADVRPQGDTVFAPGGLTLRVPGSRWQLADGRLALVWDGSHPVEAVPHPAPAEQAHSRRLQGPGGGRRGWWQSGGQLTIDLGAGRWLRVGGLSEAQAFQLLAALEAEDHAQPAANAA